MFTRIFFVSQAPKILDFEILEKIFEYNTPWPLKICDCMILPKFSICPTFYQFIMNRNKNLYSLYDLRTQNFLNFEQTRRHIHIKIWETYRENKFILGETK